MTENEQRERLHFVAENKLSVAAMRKAIGEWRGKTLELEEENPPYVKHYQTFATRQLQWAKKAQEHERQQMAEQLEALAKQIRSL